jgi:hypothetical protein
MLNNASFKAHPIWGQGIDSHFTSKSSSPASRRSTQRAHQPPHPQARQTGQHHRGRADAVGDMGYAFHPNLPQRFENKRLRLGMLPIVQWLISLERAPPPTRRLLTIERTQGWSMLAFYPLHHLSYLRKHDLVPTALPLPSGLPSSSSSGKPRRVTINGAAISQWSSRLWATYFVLQLAHLCEDRALLIKKQRALSRLSSMEKERAELARRWSTWRNEIAVNLSFLPITIHGYDSLPCFIPP